MLLFSPFFAVARMPFFKHIRERLWKMMFYWLTDWVAVKWNVKIKHTHTNNRWERLRRQTIATTKNSQPYVHRLPFPEQTNIYHSLVHGNAAQQKLRNRSSNSDFSPSPSTWKPSDLFLHVWKWQHSVRQQHIHLGDRNYGNFGYCVNIPQ